MNSIQYIELSSTSSAVKPAFDRSRPCVFRCSSICKSQVSSDALEDGDIPEPDSLHVKLSAMVSSFSSLSSLSLVVDKDSVNSIRVHDRKHELKTTEEMTFSNYTRTIASGEASAKDMYWACGHILQPSILEPLFSQLEELFDMPSSPPLTAWVGSEHTEQLHYDDEDNLHLMLHGHKRWLVFPPGAPLHYPSFRALLTAPTTTAPSAMQPDPCTSPLDASRLQAPINIVLSPGDLMYLPAAWSHQVQSLPENPQSFVFSVNKFYPTSLLTCARRGSAWAVAKCRIWDFKLTKEGWEK